MCATPFTDALPADIRVFDRGWLSSSNTLCLGAEPALIDTGHVKHAEQTLTLIRAALAGAPLARIAHTHLHSDHCGGTHTLQATWADAVTSVPAASFPAVRSWDQDLLTYRATGQRCPPFRADEPMAAGEVIHLGERDWQVHPAPGHDALAVLLFDAADRILIAGDALWEDGIGIIFPEIDGTDTFARFRHTLDVIEALRPDWVIPGHGQPFNRGSGAVDRALEQAHKRIRHFEQHPKSHAIYAAKVLVKYELMDAESMTREALAAWAERTPDLQRLHRLAEPDAPWRAWIHQVIDALIERGALREHDGVVADVQTRAAEKDRAPQQSGG